jgi:uncharacterized membrane protein YbaN (DUF454 family)
MHKKIYQGLFVLLGILFLGIGLIGIVIPVLPTTPFLLLASFFLAKGSKRFHTWFLNTRIYKKYLSDFVQTRVMTLKRKWCILLPASLLLMIACIYAPVWHIQVVIILVMIFKYYYFFFKIKTVL